MFQFVLIFATGLLGGSVVADTLDRAERPCRAELLRGAEAACLRYIAEQRDAAMEARIAATLSGLQAARPADLRALAIRYREAQSGWRAATAERCDIDDVILAQRCRLAAVLAREEEVALSLARATADLCGSESSEIRTSKAVEVLIPLEVPSGIGAGDETVRLPLLVPLLP